jgi:hypothetical protein
LSGETPEMKNDSREKDVVVAVPVVEEARVALLASGVFEACPGSDNLLIDNENGIQVRLIPISRRD